MLQMLFDLLNKLKHVKLTPSKFIPSKRIQQESQISLLYELTWHFIKKLQNKVQTQAQECIINSRTHKETKKAKKISFDFT